MRQNSFWDLALAYAKKHVKTLVLFAFFILVVFVVYELYGLSPGPVIYTGLLVGVMALVLGAAGVGRYRRKLRRLLVLRRQAGEGLGELPRPADRAEEEYHAIIRALEARSQRARQLAEQREAEATRYYTLWSHQIKTPLAAMRLLLQEEELDRGAFGQELLKTEQYVEMVLQYQRLGAATRDLALQEVPLEKLVKEAVKRAAPLFIHKRIGLELSPIAARAVTDEKWMVFVLEQLLSNAVKYTPQGKVSISPAPGVQAGLVIEDTGIGIRPEDLPRIFEWGYTGYTGRQDSRSTGVGLSLCRQVLEMLGHTIAITSRPGEGTRVVLDLSRERLELD